MYLAGKDAQFLPVQFEVLNFYGEETCFAWCDKYLAVFPFVNFHETPKTPSTIAPAKIKCFRCFESRVFVVCEPKGVYKLTKTLTFALLSARSIGIGPVYYQTYAVENQWLFLKNKLSKTNKQLFKLHPERQEGHHHLCDITLNSENSDVELRKAFHLLEDNVDGDVLIIANEKRVFKVSQNDVQLLYSCEHKIINICSILQAELIVGFVFITKTTAAVVVYLRNGNLVSDKVYLDTNVKELTAGRNTKSNDFIWIACLDGSHIYYYLKKISANSFRGIRKVEGKFVSLKNYKCKFLIGLVERELLKISIESFEFDTMEIDEFVQLRQDMLKGTEQIMEKICDKAKELQCWNEKLLEEQEKLKLINMYAHKQSIIFLPTVKIQRMANQLFIRVIFDNVLPMNCYVIVVLKWSQKTTYSMKLIEDSLTIVDVPLVKDTINSSLELRVDLVTFTCESQPWCLIQNYTKSPKPLAEDKTSSNKSRFCTAKLAALKDLIAEGNVDIKKLSSIKNSIRKELQNS